MAEIDPLPVLYDQDCGLCTRTARLLRRLDRRGRLQLVPFEEARRRGLASELSPDEFHASFHAVLPEGVLSGARAIPAVLDRLPGGAPVASGIRRSPFLQRVTERTYEFVARNRRRWSGCTCGPHSPTPPKGFNAARK